LLSAILLIYETLCARIGHTVTLLSR